MQVDSTSAAPAESEHGEPPRPIPASLSRRATSAIVDLLPLSVLALALAERQGDVFRLDNLRLLVFVALMLLYYFIAELVTAGTPGKHLVGLVVTDELGSRPSFKAIASRNALRLIDGLPVLYLVGFVTAVVTPDNRRIGDLAAKTIVVEKAVLHPDMAKQSFKRGGTVVLSVSLVALALGISAGLIITRPPESVPSRDFHQEVQPFAFSVGDALREPNPVELVDMFIEHPNLDTSWLPTLIEGIGEYAGPIEGDLTVESNRVLRSAQIDGISRPHDISIVIVHTEFANGPGTFTAHIVDFEGELKIFRIHVVLDADL